MTLGTRSREGLGLGLLLLSLAGCESPTEPRAGLSGTYALLRIEPGIELPYVRMQTWVGETIDRVLRVHGVLRIDGGHAVIRYEDLSAVWEKPGALRTTRFRFEPSSAEYRVQGVRDSLYLEGPTPLAGRVSSDTLLLHDDASGLLQTWVRVDPPALAGAQFVCLVEEPYHWFDIRRMLIRSERDRMSWWGCVELEQEFGRLRFTSGDGIELGPYKGQYTLDPQTLVWEATVRGPGGEFALRGYVENDEIVRLALIQQGDQVFAYGTLRFRRHIDPKA